LESLLAASESVMHEAVRVKPKLQWRLRDVGNARSVEHLLKKAAGNEQSQTEG
jgi:hypothetical protein